MDYKLVVTSDRLEPILCFGQQYKEVGYPDPVIYFATTRLRGECYCRPVRGKTRGETREKVMTQVSKWAEDNLTARCDLQFFSAGGLDYELILTFIFDFEEESDAVFFFLKYK